MKSQKVGRFTVEAQKWEKYGKSRIYFTLLESGNTNAQACWSNDESRFIKCRNRCNARFENAIKEVFNL